MNMTVHDFPSFGGGMGRATKMHLLPWGFWRPDNHMRCACGTKASKATYLHYCVAQQNSKVPRNWELVSLLNPTCAAFTSRKPIGGGSSRTSHWPDICLDGVFLAQWHQAWDCLRGWPMAFIGEPKVPPKVQQFVILPLKLPVWGIPHVSKLSLNILNMIAKPQSHRCHRNYMNSALVAASIFREIAGTKPREQRWFPA